MFSTHTYHARSYLSFAALSCALCAVSSAQDLTHKARPQNGPVAIVNAHIHPVVGEDVSGYIIFEKGVITQIGAGKLEAAAGTRVVDVQGKHVYPGMIAALTQLGLDEIGALRQTRDFNEVGDITPEAKAVVSINPDSTLFPVTRANGVLTAAVFPSGGTIAGQPCVVRLDGWTWEEMSVAPSLGVTVAWPNVRPVTAWWMNRSREDQERDIKRSLAAIDDFFRLSRQYAVERGADANTPLDLRMEAMRPLFSAGVGGKDARQARVFITANDVDQIQQAVAWAKGAAIGDSTGMNLSCVIVGGRDAWMCADLLKRHDVPVIVSGVHGFPRRDDSDYDEVYSFPARLEAAGVAWCMASGEETPHERSLPHHAGRAVAYGLDPKAALESVTIRAARILGVDSTLGSLEKGKSATLIVCDGTPLEVKTKVEHAFIDGREIDLSSKQTKLNEKYRERFGVQEKN